MNSIFLRIYGGMLGVLVLVALLGAGGLHLLNQYRAHLKATRKSGASGVFEVMARGFAAEFGKLRVRDLKPFKVDAWLAGQTQWNNTSKARAITLILAAVSWARKKGYIVTNPLAGQVEREARERGVTLASVVRISGTRPRTRRRSSPPAFDALPCGTSFSRPPSRKSP